jgi:hypothetical protein
MIPIKIFIERRKARSKRPPQKMVDSFGEAIPKNLLQSIS